MFQSMDKGFFLNYSHKLVLFINIIASFSRIDQKFSTQTLFILDNLISVQKSTFATLSVVKQDYPTFPVRVQAAMAHRVYPWFSQDLLHKAALCTSPPWHSTPQWVSKLLWKCQHASMDVGVDSKRYSCLLPVCRPRR